MAGILNVGDISASGNIVAAGDVTAFSDERLKEDIKPIENALEKVLKLTGYTFKMTTNDTQSTGVIAQEVQQILPEAVRQNEEYLSVAYGNMVGLLIEAIKEQQKQIDELLANK